VIEALFCVFISSWVNCVVIGEYGFLNGLSYVLRVEVVFPTVFCEYIVEDYVSSFM